MFFIHHSYKLLKYLYENVILFILTWIKEDYGFETREFSVVDLNLRHGFDEFVHDPAANP